MAQAAMPTLPRVKLYSLNANRQWVARGTGFVACEYKTTLNGKNEEFTDDVIAQIWIFVLFI